MIKFILYPIVIYCVLLLILYFFQNSVIYFPDNTVYTPAEAGVPEMKVVELTTPDGLKIHAWYRPPNPSKPTIVYFHGNGGSIANRGPIVRPFLDQGYGVLLVTYRGYSGNPGSPNEKGLYNDARAALNFVKGQCIVLYGESIGCAVAIQMATEFKAEGLVLQGPFTSLADVAQFHYPYIVLKSLIADKYDSLTKASKISYPVLIVHGEKDDIIPPDLSRKLFEKFSGPKEAKYIPNRGHNDLFEPEIVIAFIKKYVRCQAASSSSL